MGLAIASLIISNTLISEINHQRSQGVLPNDYLNYMQNHIYSKIDTSVLTHDQVVVVRQMYMTSIRNFFYLTIPLLAICLITNLFVKDKGLQCIDEEPEE